MNYFRYHGNRRRLVRLFDYIYSEREGRCPHCNPEFKNIKDIADKKDEKFKSKTANLIIDVMDSVSTSSLDWQTCTVDGVQGQQFHPSVDISQMDTYVYKIKAIARDLFGYYYTPYINSTYYIWGEYDPGLGVHEGCDLRYTANAHESFRTIVDGTVTRVEKDGTGYGILGVYKSAESSTYFFQHAYDYEDDVVVNQPINGNYYKCYQWN